MLPQFLAVSFLALIITGCAAQIATSGRVAIQDQSPQTVSFSERDRTLIRDYYGKKKKAAPKSTAPKGSGSPSGVAKRDVLPSGLRWESLPSDLERLLSSLPSGYVRVRVGDDVLLLDNRTRVVTDIVYGAAT